MPATATAPAPAPAPAPATFEHRNEPRAQTDFPRHLANMRPHLLCMARRWAREMAAAEDLVQETLRKALEARARFRRGSNLRAWATSIMRNLFIDGCRKRNQAEALDFEPEGGVSPPEEPDPLDVLSMDDVHSALDGLRFRDREIFTLCCFQKLSYRQVSDRLGIALATVGTRLHRARAKLRRRLQRRLEARLLANGDDAPTIGGKLAPLRRISHIGQRERDAAPRRL